MGVLLILQFVGVTIILQPYSTKGQDITTCVYDLSSCSCDTNKGKIELYRASSATPYNAINTITPETYYWLPCTDFTFNGVTGGIENLLTQTGTSSLIEFCISRESSDSLPQNIATLGDTRRHNPALEISFRRFGNRLSCVDFLTMAIQYVPSTKAVFSLGTHSSAFSDVKDGYARFNMNGGVMSRNTFVTCVCGSGGYIVFQGEEPKLSYNFAFYSDVCCLGIEIGISVGSILVIVVKNDSEETIAVGDLWRNIVGMKFFSLLVVYFLFGTVFQTAVRKAQGRERIPNIAFWSLVPGLIKDGVLFTFSCGRRVGYGKV